MRATIATMGERRRREAAQSETASAVLAYVRGDDASMYNLLDGPARSDTLGLALRLASLAGTALARLAAAEGVDPEVALATLLEHSEAGRAAEFVEAIDLGVVWEPNAPEAVLVTSDGDLTVLALRARSDAPTHAAWC